MNTKTIRTFHVITVLLIMVTMASFPQSAVRALSFTGCSNVTEIPQAECDALVSLYKSTNGDNWINNTNWLVTDSPCEWYGVTCSEGHVTRLDLNSNQLDGTIPLEIKNLSYLVSLDLSSNKPAGKLPGKATTQTIPAPPSSCTASGAIRSFTLTQSLPANDDGSSATSIPLGFTMDYFGTSYTSVYVNNNGNVTFGADLYNFTPSGMGGVSYKTLAPFFADVDTRGTGGGTVSFDQVTVDTRPAFAVNWHNVGYYNSETDKLNDFQLVIINRSDRAAGDWDVEYNYGQIQWETGSASEGVNGFGGISAGVGFSDGSAGSSDWQLAGSLVPGSFLNSNSTSGLIHTSQNSSICGRRLIEIVSGNPSGFHQISGSLGIDGAGAAINYGGSVIHADGTGDYSITVEDGWTGIITPSKTSRAFSPTSITISTPVTSDLINQNFVTTITGSSVLSVDLATSYPEGADNVDFTVTFDMSVTGVEISDFALTTTGVAGASITNVSGSGDTYTVSVNTGTGNGSVRLDVLDDDTILHNGSAPLGGPGLDNGNFTTGEVYYVTRGPSVWYVERAGSSPTDATSVDFTVTFSRNVTGVDISDFALTTTGVTGASITNVSGADDVYTVTVNTGSGNGTIRLDVLDDDTILDSLSRPLGGPGLDNGGFTFGSVYSIVRGPIVLYSVRAGVNPTSAASVAFTVIFDSTVTGVDSSDFVLTTTGVSGTSITNVSGSDDTYTVTVNTGSGNGTIRLDVLDDDTIVDGLSRPLGGAGLDNGGFITGEVYDVSKPVKATYKSTAAQDGYILESTEASNKGGTMNTAATLLYVGDATQDKQYKSILSFDTSSLPNNAVITKVQVKIKVNGFVGGNMFTPSKTLGNLLVDIRKSYFGANANLAVSDFEATASKSGVGTLASVSGVGWYTITLNSTAYSSVNLTSTTQLRLRFQKDDNDDLSADYLKVYSGNAPAASQPQLIVEYYIP